MLCLHISVEERKTFMLGDVQKIHCTERTAYTSYLMCNSSWLGYLNAGAPPRQAVTSILVQIPLSLLSQKAAFPLVVHNSYMAVDPSD